MREPSLSHNRAATDPQISGGRTRISNLRVMRVIGGRNRGYRPYPDLRVSPFAVETSEVSVLHPSCTLRTKPLTFSLHRCGRDSSAVATVQPPGRYGPVDGAGSPVPPAPAERSRKDDRQPSRPDVVATTRRSVRRSSGTPSRDVLRAGLFGSPQRRMPNPLSRPHAPGMPVRGRVAAGVFAVLRIRPRTDKGTGGRQRSRGTGSQSEEAST